MEEINYAWNKWHDKKKILVIYDVETGKNLAGTEHCTEIYINSRKEDMSDIAKKVQYKLNELTTPAQKKNNALSPLEGIILAGLGIWLLDTLINNDR